MSLDLPEPHGSSRYCDSRTTPLTPASCGLSSWSIDTDTSTHTPFGISVLHVLNRKENNTNKIHSKNSDSVSDIPDTDRKDVGVNLPSANLIIK